MKLRTHFSIASVLWLTLLVAVFFAGRYTMVRQLHRQLAESRQLRAVAAREQALAEQLSIQAKNFVQQYSELANVPIVIGVSQGLMITIWTDEQRTEVKLFGIECPAPGEPLFDEARDFTVAFCLDKRVQLVRAPGQVLDIRIERADRTRPVAQPFESLREHLLQEGYARLQNNIFDNGLLAELEAQAKRQQLGVWGLGDDKPPSAE